ACACAFGHFIPICVESMRLQMRLHNLAIPGRTHDLGLCIAWSEVAEDARFELARACTQHAFQQCWPAFTGVRHRPRTAQTRSERTLVNGAGRRRMRQKLRQETGQQPRTGEEVRGAMPRERRGDLLRAAPGATAA